MNILFLILGALYDNWFVILIINELSCMIPLGRHTLNNHSIWIKKSIISLSFSFLFGFVLLILIFIFLSKTYILSFFAGCLISFLHKLITGQIGLTEKNICYFLANTPDIDKDKLISYLNKRSFLVDPFLLEEFLNNYEKKNL